MNTLINQKDRFSLTEGVRYLNCAYMGPLPKVAEEAAVEAVRRKGSPESISAVDFFEPTHEMRERFAALINAPSALDIAVLPSASYGIETVARNVSVAAGQNIVVLHEQFPSNVYPWRRIAQEVGAEIRTVAAAPPEERSATGEGRGASWSRRILEAIDEQTAVVAIGTVHWTDGTKYDLEAIGARARSVGAAFVLDGSQSVGAVPIDVTALQPDALIVAGYKWLLGPYSLSLGYFGESLQDGQPLEETWTGRLGSEVFGGLVEYVDEYQSGAVRFDVGERSNFWGTPAMLASLELLLEWSPESISAYCAALMAPALDQLEGLGIELEDRVFLSPHLMGLRLPDHMSREALVASLDRHRLCVSFRGSSIRVSPHVYNTEEDVAVLVAAVAEAVG